MERVERPLRVDLRQSSHRREGYEVRLLSALLICMASLTTR